jgi:DNA helicase-4
MINKAAEAIFRRDVEVGYSHVIIDEFQDISDARLQLLRAIRSQKPNCKIFAVGDDWQAIYRFAGSDVTLFTQFAEQFGETAVMRIETTYRFAPPLLDVASKFILKNPSQYRKILRAADRQKRTKLDLLPTKAGGEVGQALKQIAEEGETFVGKRVLILGRYGHDERCMAAPEFKLKDAKNRIYEWSDQLSGKVVRASNVQFMTMHKAKGIEGEIVILANCGAGRYGMPAEIVDDPMLDMLLAKPENHPNAEERRLFYVALTRAKERAMIVVPTDNPSKFAVELGFKASRAPKSACPECESGEIIMKKRNADGSEFYGCTNYYFGCSYTEVRRPLVKSHGR